MRKFVLVILVLAILSGCSTTKVNDSIVVTGTRVDRSEIKTPTTAKVSGKIFKLYFDDTKGDFNKIFEVVMSDIGAPIPSDDLPIENVLEMINSTGASDIYKSQSKISMFFYSASKKRKIKITYLFENQQYKSYSIE